MIFYSAATVSVVLTVALLVSSLFDWNRLKGPLQRAASAHLGRPVTLAGPVNVRLWSRTPTVTLADLTIGGPSWEADRPVAKIERLTLQLELRAVLSGHLVLHRVEVLKPQLYLHQEKSGRANWTAENRAPTNEPAPPPTHIPAMRDLLIESGRIELLDELRHLKLKGTIEARDQGGPTDTRPFRVYGTGTINHEPFKLGAFGGALIGISPQRPYPFKLTISAGENDIAAEGQVIEPFNLGKLDLKVHAHGRDLAELYYLTQLALPNSPPFDLTVQVVRDGQHVAARDIRGTLGKSDIRGRVDIDASHKRPFLKAQLASQHLFLRDLGAVTGAKAGAGASLDNAAPAQPSAAPNVAPRALFPDARLQVDRVRAMDAELDFRATSIEAGSVPFTQVAAHVHVRQGKLTIDPLQFALPQGLLKGTVRLDARGAEPAVHLELQATNIKLDQLKGRSPDAEPPLDGLLQARVVLNGHGDSVHQLMSHASGTLTAIVPHGDIRSAFAELTGVDVAEGVGLLLKKPDERAPIRCGVARFDISDGVARAQSLVFDTQKVLITGRGELQLASEQLNLTIEGQPKKPRLVRIRAPVKVDGPLRAPAFHLEGGHLLKQGSIAAALGTVLSPIAAILAFVDPGLAKDQDCAQLLAQIPAQIPVTRVSTSGNPLP